MMTRGAKGSTTPRRSLARGKAQGGGTVLIAPPTAAAEPEPVEVLVVNPGPPLAQLACPDNIRFRQMELKDAASVFHLGEEVFNADSFPQLYRTWDAFEVTEMLATDSDLCIIAEEVEPSSPGRQGGEGGEEAGHKEGASRIVGFVFGSITEKRKRDQSCGLLGWVGVTPTHQRKNIGTILVHKLFNLFLDEDIRLVVADTPRENNNAIRFLERIGFSSPVYHVYMHYNLAKGKEAKQHHHHKAQAAVPLPTEAKAIKIRPMTIDDLLAVHDLGEKIYDATLYPNLYRIWSEAEVVELFGSDSENCQVAELHGRVVGFVMGTTLEKRRSAWKYGYLVWLGVAPEFQKYGVGRKLFNAFHDLMDEAGCRIIMIDTQADNIPARKFFERAGFGSVEAHVYLSKTLSADDAIASEERVTRQSSGESFNDLLGLNRADVMQTTKARVTTTVLKVTRLFKFKRSHALLEGQSRGASGGQAMVGTTTVGNEDKKISPSAPVNVKAKEKEQQQAKKRSKTGSP